MKRKKQGFTLVELLAVIVILAVIALIATPIVLNIIETTTKSTAEISAVRYVNAIESEVVSGTLEGKKYTNKEDYAYNEIEVYVSGKTPTSGMYSLKDGMVETGMFCINGYKVNYNAGNAKAQEKCNGNDLKYEGKISLSANTGTVTYPNTGTFEITENLSGGTLSCMSSDEDVATCSISGTTVTIVTGGKEGAAIFTIKSEETSLYKEAQASYVVNTKEGIMSYTATGYEGIYDGEAHGITVTSSDATIEYGTLSGSYTSTSSPTYTNVGEYTVYYQVTRVGYQTITGSKNVTITKASGSVTAPTAKTLTYTGDEQALVNAGSSTTGTIKYKLGEAGTYSTTIPSATDAGSYTVYYKVEGDINHNDVEEASVSVTIGKANNTLTLSANTGTVTYPNSGTFEITKNTSGGTLSCSSSNTAAATCSISGTTVTVTPGTTEASSVTLTIKSAETTNYKEGTATYTVTSQNGTLSVTANGYEGKYDGEAHGITVTCSDATIEYGTSPGSYTLTSSPTYTNVGEYTVYYQVTRTGYQTVTGSKNVKITSLTASDVSYGTKTVQEAIDELYSLLN